MDKLPDGQGDNYYVRQNTDGSYTAVRKDVSKSDKVNVTDEGNLYSEVAIKKKNQGAANQQKGQEFEDRIASDLGEEYDTQVGFKDREELVDKGRPQGSSVVDFCSKDRSCSIEAKSYDLSNGYLNLVNNITEQAKVRVKNLPEGMKQKVVIDIRGQNVSDATKIEIMKEIVSKSNGTIAINAIEFAD